MAKILECAKVDPSSGCQHVVRGETEDEVLQKAGEQVKANNSGDRLPWGLAPDGRIGRFGGAERRLPPLHSGDYPREEPWRKVPLARRCQFSWSRMTRPWPS